MTRITKAERRALQLLRSRVRFRCAGFTLPGVPSEAATAAIREATSLYMETWVVPLIDALERGDIALLRLMTDRTEGEREPAGPRPVRKRE